MLIASAPSASATLIAARTISSRDSAAARRGTCRPPRFMSSSTCRRRRAARRSSVRQARNGAQSSSSSAATVTPSWPGRPSGVPTLANLSEFGAAACLSYIVLLPYLARHSTAYENSEEAGTGHIPAIETERLTTSGGPARALPGLDLTVPRGGILGLLGPNGAGKTTAVRVLATLLQPDAGHARVLGADVVRQAG